MRKIANVLGKLNINSVLAQFAKSLHEIGFKYTRKVSGQLQKLQHFWSEIMFDGLFNFANYLVVATFAGI